MAGMRLASPGKHADSPAMRAKAAPFEGAGVRRGRVAHRLPWENLTHNILIHPLRILS